MKCVNFDIVQLSVMIILSSKPAQLIGLYPVTASLEALCYTWLRLVWTYIKNGLASPRLFLYCKKIEKNTELLCLIRFEVKNPLIIWLA